MPIFSLQDVFEHFNCMLLNTLQIQANEPLLLRCFQNYIVFVITFINKQTYKYIYWIDDVQCDVCQMKTTS